MYAGNAVPILHVADLEASVRYYTGVLGFEVDWRDPTGVASVSWGKCTLFLCQGDQGNPGSWVWIGVGDAAQRHEELKKTGAIIRHPPTNFEWALELQVADPDGNVLRLGSDPVKGQPYGPWLDMNGARWIPGDDGRWHRDPDGEPKETAPRE